MLIVEILFSCIGITIVAIYLYKYIWCRRNSKEQIAHLFEVPFNLKDKFNKYMKTNCFNFSILPNPKCEETEIFRVYVSSSDAQELSNRFKITFYPDLKAYI